MNEPGGGMFLRYGSPTRCSLCISSSISRGVGMQIPPEDPEAWSPGLSREGLAWAAAKYARRGDRDDRL